MCEYGRFLVLFCRTSGNSCVFASSWGNNSVGHNLVEDVCWERIGVGCGYTWERKLFKGEEGFEFSFYGGLKSMKIWNGKQKLLLCIRTHADTIGAGRKLSIIPTCI